MKRVCLLVDDDPAIISALSSILEGLFAKRWGGGPALSIKLQTAQSCAEGVAQLEALRSISDLALVLITDYDLGDGVGSKLIDYSGSLEGVVYVLLQSGTPRSRLMQDPVVAGLRADQLLQKPVSVSQYIECLNAFERVWGL